MRLITGSVLIFCVCSILLMAYRQVEPDANQPARVIAYQAFDGNLVPYTSQTEILDLDTRVRKRFRDTPTNVQWLEWTPDGQTLILTTWVDAVLEAHFMDVETGDTRTLGDNIVDFHVAPNGQQAAYVVQNGETSQVFIADFDQQTLTWSNARSVGNGETFTFILSWSPNSEWFTYADKYYTISREAYLIRAADQTITPVPSSYISWFPQGSEFAYATTSGDNPQFHVRDASTGIDRVIEIDFEIEGIIGLPVWSPDGRKIAFNVQGNKTQMYFQDQTVYVADADGKNVVLLTPDAGNYFPLAWFPDSKALMAVSQGALGHSQLLLFEDVTMPNDHQFEGFLPTYATGAFAIRGLKTTPSVY